MAKSSKIGTKKSRKNKLSRKTRSRKTRSRKTLSSRRSGKSRILIPVTHPGTLTGLGYSMSKSKYSRHRALNKALKLYGYAMLMRKLNILYTFNKKRNPKIAAIAEEDKKWLMKKHN
jgi:hypothetical protein